MFTLRIFASGRSRITTGRTEIIVKIRLGREIMRSNGQNEIVSVIRASRDNYDYFDMVDHRVRTIEHVLQDSRRFFSCSSSGRLC
jgi:hypothetical protein